MEGKLERANRSALHQHCEDRVEVIVGEFLSSSSVRSCTGWGINTRAGSIPSDLAPAAAPSMNSVVATPTVGMPRASRSAMSCVQHEMQDPQSDNPSMTRLTSLAICCRNDSGAGRVLVGLA